MVSLLIWGCASHPMPTVESGSPASSSKKVLLVTQNSKFKRAVASEIYAALKSHPLYIKMIDVKNLVNQPTADFSVVVIINKYMAGRPDPRVESFVDREFQNNKIVVLTTGFKDSWKPDHPGVDAISSASVLEKSDQIARSIVDSVLVLLNSR